MLVQVNESQNDMTSGEVLSGGPGIVVLSPLLQILHMNRQAIKLVSLLGSAEPKGQQSYDPTGVLHPALINLAGEIIKVLHSRHEINEKGHFEIRHAANGSGKPLAIRGVGVPNGQGVEHARIVLVLTEEPATLSESHHTSINVS